MTKQEFILMHVSNYCVAAKIKSISEAVRITKIAYFYIEDAIAHAELIWEKLPAEYKTKEQ